MEKGKHETIEEPRSMRNTAKRQNPRGMRSLFRFMALMVTKGLFFPFASAGSNNTQCHPIQICLSAILCTGTGRQPPVQPCGDFA